MDDEWLSESIVLYKSGPETGTGMAASVLGTGPGAQVHHRIKCVEHVRFPHLSFTFIVL